MKIEEEIILTLLQYGDSFFPSGSVSFSWGIEMLVQDHVINTRVQLEKFIENHLIDRWSPFDRNILIHSYCCADNLEEVASIDFLVECMSLATELRVGSKRLGLALLSTFGKLNNQTARRYLTFIDNDNAHGHLPVIQGLLWNSIGLTKKTTLILSAYTFCVSVLSAALRLGIVGHLDCQKSLINVRKLITELTKLPSLDLDKIYSFIPIVDIASMRHEVTNTRLFAN